MNKYKKPKPIPAIFDRKPKKAKRVAQQAIAKSTEKYSDRLTLVDPIDYPSIPKRDNLLGVWISKKFLVQIYQEPNRIVRLSVNKTSLQGTGFRKEGNMAWAEISWEELQEIKNEVGYGHLCATEIYPPESKVINVANMRHLWVLPEEPSYMWGAEINHGLEHVESIDSTPIAELDVPCFCNQCEPDDWYQCAECHRIVPNCFGADDDYYELCDDCAVEQMNAKEAILDLSLGNSISVNPLWLALKIKHTDEYTNLVNSLFIGGKVQAISRLQIASGMTDRAFVDALGGL